MEINYTNLLYKRLEKYESNYSKKPLIVFLKLIYWSFTYCIKKIFKPALKTIGKDKNKLYIGIGTGGVRRLYISCKLYNAF